MITKRTMNRGSSKGLFLTVATISTAAFLMVSSEPLTMAQQGNAVQDENAASRDILIKRFTEARPSATTPTQSVPRAGKTGVVRRAGQRKAVASARRRPHYRRASTPLSSPFVAMASASELGVTIWRMRPAISTDNGARTLVMENARPRPFTAERIEADTQLRVNDRVRISIESPRRGFLYVVDREQYADGSMGEPFLIFPTTRTHGGDNQVRPGKLIDLPALEDDPNYFTLVPSPSREDQVAEILSIVVTTQPLEGLRITDKPLRVSSGQIGKWEKQWNAQMERYEMEGGAGLSWSNEEKEASAAGSARYLTQEDPSPQTIYLVEGKNNSGLLETVPLRYRIRG